MRQKMSAKVAKGHCLAMTMAKAKAWALMPRRRRPEALKRRSYTMVGQKTSLKTTALKKLMGKRPQQNCR